MRYILATLLSLFTLPVFAADMPVKAPASTATTPLCTVTNCSGFYAGASISGNGSSADIIGSGLDGSVFAGGEIPAGVVGWQYWNGSLFFAIEGGAGYQSQSTATVNGQSGNENGWMTYEIVKFGGDLSGLLGTGQAPITVPTTIASHLMAPYACVGSVQRSFATGWATCAGAEFDLTSNVFLDLRYTYVNYGAATNGALNFNAENLVTLGLNYAF